MEARPRLIREVAAKSRYQRRLDANVTKCDNRAAYWSSLETALAYTISNLQNSG